MVIAFACLIQAQSRTPVDQAWDLLAKGQRDEALTLLRKTVAADARNGDARLLLGSVLAEEGNLDAALPELESAVRLKPRSALAFNALGEALQATSKVAGARQAFQKAVALDPKLGQARVNFGALLLQAGDSARAATQLDEAVRILGSSPEAAYPHYLRAKIFVEQGQPERAVTALKKAVSLRPDFGEAWSDLGDVHRTLRDDDAAFDAFRQSVQVDPENAVSQYRLGAEYLRRGQRQEAIAHLEESLRFDANNQSALNSLQLALRQEGRREEADRIKIRLAGLLQTIDRENQNAVAALRLSNEGTALEQKGDLAGAIAKYRAAAALDATHAGIHVNLGIALLRRGEWKEGLSELREASRLDPANEKVSAVLTDALEQAPIEYGGKGRRPAPPRK